MHNLNILVLTSSCLILRYLLTELIIQAFYLANNLTHPGVLSGMIRE